MPGLHWQNIRMSFLVIINDQAGEGLSDSSLFFRFSGFFDSAGGSIALFSGSLGLGGSHRSVGLQGVLGLLGLDRTS
jgi:hypothetical protein